MSVLRRLGAAFGRRSKPEDVPVSDNTESDAEHEGLLEPNTAALTEGAPPAGAGGRIQPSGGSPDPRPARGPSEGEVQNFPG